MFTGIVRGVGSVVASGDGPLGVEHADIAARLEIGGSIAVNGVCLTVVGVEGGAFFAEVVPETRRRTNLGQLRPGDLVNLEPPITLDRGLDGHVVQGHVDGTTAVREIRDVALGREVFFELPPGLAAFVAEKGSVTIDGTSLTVAAVDDADATFSVALIPHTLQHTVAGRYVPGTLVNVEVDVVARYVERILHRSASAGR